MTRMAFETIGPEDLKQMIERDVRKSKSIYAPSGPPDTRLLALFKEVSSQERIVKLASSEQTKIDVTFTLDLEALSATNPEKLGSMIKMLLHDGHRRLVSGKIGVEESSYHDNPDRLVYSCAKSSRSRIKKFINAWKRAQLPDS